MLHHTKDDEGNRVCIVLSEVVIYAEEHWDEKTRYTHVYFKNGLDWVIKTKIDDFDKEMKLFHNINSSKH
jgi:hypothetical protein